jgi:hypothetical protein
MTESAGRLVARWIEVVCCFPRVLLVGLGECLWPMGFFGIFKCGAKTWNGETSKSPESGIPTVHQGDPRRAMRSNAFGFIWSFPRNSGFILVFNGLRNFVLSFTRSLPSLHHSYCCSLSLMRSASTVEILVSTVSLRQHNHERE